MHGFTAVPASCPVQVSSVFLPMQLSHNMHHDQDIPEPAVADDTLGSAAVPASRRVQVDAVFVPVHLPHDVHVSQHAVAGTAHNSTTVPAGGCMHIDSGEVLLPIHHHAHHSAAMPRPAAQKRRPGVSTETPPARRRATPSPARAENPLRAQEYEHDASIRIKIEELRLAGAVHEQLRSEVREARICASAEEASSRAYRLDAEECRAINNAANAEHSVSRTDDAYAAQLATTRAVAKANSEAERLHAILLHISESEAQARHDAIISTYRSELHTERMTYETSSHEYAARAPRECPECQVRAMAIRALEAQVSSLAISYANACAAQQAEAGAVSVLKATLSDAHANHEAGIQQVTRQFNDAMLSHGNREEELSGHAANLAT